MNEYLPFSSEIVEVVKETEIESTFRMAYEGEAKPGQFFQVSIPKFGEAPISVSGLGKGYIDLTIRKIGRVTDEVFNYTKGGKLFLRGPYGNGFDVELYKGRELVVVAGGTGLSPVKGVVDYFAQNTAELSGFSLIAGFKSPQDILFKKEMEAWQKKLNVVLTVDNAQDGYSGNVGLVTQFIPELKIESIADVQVIIVGPPVMISFAAKEFLKRGVPTKNIWISLERRMSCGIGKCGHCKIDDVYICLEGPVFNYEKGVELID
ncbi:MAG: anaerobic sulfite reductase subunit AsrB [Defluviitaleaceae bacterium]|nr:anaerobic sulfite reductase subunit AsrB [Defluviitaleaceae bacterium]